MTQYHRITGEGLGHTRNGPSPQSSRSLSLPRYSSDRVFNSNHRACCWTYSFFKIHAFFSKKGLRCFEESNKLHELLASAKWHHDAEEVDSWYFLLSGIAGSQDFVRGTYQEKSSRNSTTASILQLFINNLPESELPPWKIEMARQFLKVHTYKSGSAVTKIINEELRPFSKRSSSPISLTAITTSFSTLRS